MCNRKSGKYNQSLIMSGNADNTNFSQNLFKQLNLENNKEQHV